MKKYKFTILISIILIFAYQSLLAAPKKKIWDYWNKSNENNLIEINHSVWQNLLSKYIKSSDGINYVSYNKFTQKDKQALDNYIKYLTELNILNYTKNEQFAYWVNLYNSLTWQLIIQHFPVKSIKDISFGIFTFGPWDEKLIQINKKEISLNDIEHRILRPIWNDDRIHYIVNCASIGCPNIAKKALTSKNYQQILNQSRKDYLNHKRAVNKKNQILTLSSLFDWYLKDFAKDEKQLIIYISKFSNQLTPTSKYKTIKYHYDWNLNCLC